MNNKVHKKSDSRSTPLKWFNNLAGLALLASFATALYFAYRSGLVPSRLLIIGGLATGIIVLGICLVIFRNKSSSTVKNFFLSATSLFLTTSFIIAVYLANQTNLFVSRLSAADYEEVSYSIAALKSKNVSLKTNNRLIGHLKEDPNNNQVLKEVKEITSATPIASDNITAVTVTLTDGNLDSIVLRDSSLELLRENYQKFTDSLVILHTFTIKVLKTENTKQTDVTKPFAVYISGIDTYGELNKVARSDVNLLAIVNPVTNKILLVNTPRDYYVQLHGTTGYRDKLTHAGVYGIEMSRDTLEDLYGIDINYYVRVNFSSLEKTVDLIGGITVSSDVAFKAGKYNFVAGPSNLDGKAALAFSRERYGFAEGDRQRGMNQQKVLSAVVEKATSPSVIVKNQFLLRSLDGVFQTDAPSQVITQILRKQLDTIGQWQVESISVTGKDSRGPTYSMGNVSLYVMEPDIESLNSAKVKIQEFLN